MVSRLNFPLSMKIIPQSPPNLQDALNQFLISISKSPHTAGSYRPYYKEEYAKDLIPILKEIASTGKPYFFPKGMLSITTIRIKLYQSLAYLKDHLDPNKEFQELLERLEVSTVKGRGVSLRPKDTVGILEGYLTESWRPELLRYLDSAEPNEKFERLGLNLSNEDIGWVHRQIEPVQRLFVYDVSRRHIKIIRYTHED